MANPYKGEAEIKLGGETRMLIMDTNAVCNLEDILDKRIDKIFKEENMGLTTIRACIAVGLSRKRKPVSPEDAGEMMDLSELEHYSIQVGKALTGAMGSEKGTTAEVAAVADPPEPAPAPTGTA